MRFLLCILLACFLLPMVPASSQQRPSATFEEDFWNGVKDSGVPQALMEYIWLFPDGRFVEEANVEIERLRARKGQVVPTGEGRDEPKDARPADGGAAEADLQPVDRKTDSATSEQPAAPEKRIVIPAAPPVEVKQTCSERLGRLGSDAGETLCMTVLATGNLTFARDCQPMSFGFAGVSVPDEVFFLVDETLLLADTDGRSLQPTGGRPNCYLIVGEKPEKLRYYRYLMLEQGEKAAMICNVRGQCL